MTITAKVIADSVGERSPRITTLQLRYPKFIHGEFMTHRVFSRNASSSRAIPVERLIKDVLDDPTMPAAWFKNKKGMQGAEEIFGAEARMLEVAWLRACEFAIDQARAMLEIGAHKQHINRVIEPFCHINVVVTATAWSNFFALRCHPDAQPEMRLLAEAIRAAMVASTPKLLKSGEWHLPYCPDAHGKPCGLPDNLGSDDAIKASVARCARVSYLTQDGLPPRIEDDLALYDRLVAAVPLHASPAEHQATPDRWEDGARDLGFAESSAGAHNSTGWVRPDLHGNFSGWVQFRKTLSDECQ